MGAQVTAVRTPTTASAISAVILSLWSSVIGGAPTQLALAVLTTQIDVETGWANCWNYNVGNLVPSGGSNYVVVSGIQLRAFTSFQDGVTAFLALLKARYSAALASAAIGDLAGYAANLRAQGYYTATEASYLALLQARYPADAAAVVTVPAPASPASPASSPAATSSGSGGSLVALLLVTAGALYVATRTGRA
jgi:hypothetical protein